ncbi:MAG: DUF3891 family protein [Candidatus Angelobacter sp.]
MPAWNVVERLQRQAYDCCWMITQPSHAALAGEFAAKMSAAGLPNLGADLVRAIALHDAGWGIPDAQAIMQSRSVSQDCPRSFIACNVREFLAAWGKSIDIAESTGAAGGYIVSRHFWRLAEHRIKHPDENDADRNKLRRFVDNESKRQKVLATRQSHSAEELELLADVLQFCDLLSLYVCSGARENVEFPECFGMKVRLTIENEGYRLDPAVIEPGTQFAVAALRHPAKKEVSGQEIGIAIL